MEKEKIKIRVTPNLKGSMTEHEHQLDGSGFMLGMAGNIYEIECSEETLAAKTSMNIWCEEAGRTFRFRTCDLKLLDEQDLPPLPDPESFNPQLLDI